jgi:ribosomal protein S18 acetylase RimI-like enzyme
MVSESRPSGVGSAAPRLAQLPAVAVSGGGTRNAASDVDHVVETLSQAFHDDAAFVWFFPDATKRAARVRAFFRVVIAEDLAAGEVWCAAADASSQPGPGSAVAALWRAPGRADEAPLGFFATYLRFARIFFDVIPKALAIDIAMARHRPKTKFWYLRYLAVLPSLQGRGWGGRALRDGIVRAEASGVPIYLETTSPGNVALYQRFGFDVVDEWEVPRSPVRFWSMLRR